MTRRNQYICLDTLLETVFEYLQNSSIPGYKYLLRKRGIERFVWIIIHVCVLTSAFYITSLTWENFMKNPLITNMEPFAYPMSETQLPAVSICPINKISRRRAELYASKLSNQSGRPQEEILENIKYFGKLYDFSLFKNEEESVVDFQRFLDTFDQDYNVFRMGDTIQTLISPCEEIIDDCRWENKLVNCKDLFVTGLTMEGHCCIFNYLALEKKADELKVLTKDSQNKMASQERQLHGLKVKVYTNTSDYMYSILATVGTKVLISNPSDFPDISSGNLFESIVDIRSEIFLRLGYVGVRAHNEVRKYSSENRKCFFSDEKATAFGNYSYSSCLLECKIRSIIAICRCIPYIYVDIFKVEDVDQCTLTDLPCLNKYIDKWRTIYPESTKEHSLDREMQDSLRCDCLPSCEYTKYSLKREYGPLIKKNDVNYSLISVHFETHLGTLHTQDVVYYWYDIVSLFGGLFGLVMGISLISIAEIIFYFSLKLLDNIQKNKTEI